MKRLHLLRACLALLASFCIALTSFAQASYYYESNPPEVLVVFVHAQDTPSLQADSADAANRNKMFAEFGDATNQNSVLNYLYSLGLGSSAEFRGPTFVMYDEVVDVSIPYAELQSKNKDVDLINEVNGKVLSSANWNEVFRQLDTNRDNYFSTIVYVIDGFTTDPGTNVNTLWPHVWQASDIDTQVTSSKKPNRAYMFINSRSLMNSANYNKPQVHIHEFLHTLRSLYAPRSWPRWWLGYHE